jgi:deoxycytidylate deaminase
MQLALTAALNSKDPKTQVGCVLVDANKHMISVGYNAFPYGLDTKTRETADQLMKEWKKYMIVHAEANAIHHCNDPARLKGATVYVTLFPCAQCAKMLIHAQVAGVIYWSFRREPEWLDKNHEKKKKEDTYYCAQEMFRKVGIPVVPFASTLAVYDPDSHSRLDNIVRTVRKQVMLYWSLKNRELETPSSTITWPSTRRVSDGQGGYILQDTPPRVTTASSKSPNSAASRHLNQEGWKRPRDAQEPDEAGGKQQKVEPK